MGRYPLKEAIGRYMESTRAFLAPSSWYERNRKLAALARRYEGMARRNQILEQDPAKWGEEEITAILLDLKSRGLSLATQSKELQHIGALLAFVGNGTMVKMRAQNPRAFPHEQRSRGPSLHPDQMEKIFRASSNIPGWRGEVAMFIIATYAYTGLRLSELRLASVEDMDVKNWVLTVRHPKGERTYAKPRMVPIPQGLRLIVERYLAEREKMLAQRGILCSKRLLCKKYGNPDEPYSVNALQTLKRRIQEKAGVPFQYRTLRRTYGQNLLNRNVSVESVSVMLGHSSTMTTERYYCRKDADLARLEVLRAFEKSEKAPSFNPPLIDRKDDLTGYA
jgi:integrase/recombinase XerD